MGEKEPRPPLRVIDVSGPIKFARWLFRRPYQIPFRAFDDIPPPSARSARFVVQPVEGPRFHSEDMPGITPQDLEEELNELMGGVVGPATLRNQAKLRQSQQL